MKVVLCCGSGASSGFMAQSIARAAKKKGIPMEVTARSESILESFLEGTDIILVAPHLMAEREEIARRCAPVLTVVIDRAAYGMLDGEKVLKQITEALELSCERKGDC